MNDFIIDLEDNVEIMLSPDRKRILARRKHNSSLWDWDLNARSEKEEWEMENNIDVMMDDDSECIVRPEDNLLTE